MQPFYNPHLTYEKNYQYGPFGLFTEARRPMAPAPIQDFLGHAVSLPFGIASGPLLNSKFVLAAWAHGFSIATYKTVRSREVPALPYPNIVRIDTKKNYSATPREIVYGSLDLSSFDVNCDGITNSFGVPSMAVSDWQEDVRFTLRSRTAGSVLILSFMGTRQNDMTQDELILDYCKACRMAKATKAPILEVNVSCPNIGTSGMICHDGPMMAHLLEALRKEKGNTPMLVKLGYFTSEQQEVLEAVLDAAHRFAEGVVAINTIQTQVIDYHGKQELPGAETRMVSGVCGAPIRWAGIEMAERIVAHKNKNKKKDFVVVGVGGVVSPSDYFEYMKRGVTAVQSATGAMWRPTLAYEIRNYLAQHHELSN